MPEITLLEIAHAIERNRIWINKAMQPELTARILRENQSQLQAKEEDRLDLKMSVENLIDKVDAKEEEIEDKENVITNSFKREQDLEMEIEKLKILLNKCFPFVNWFVSVRQQITVKNIEGLINELKRSNL